MDGRDPIWNWLLPGNSGSRLCCSEMLRTLQWARIADFSAAPAVTVPWRVWVCQNFLSTRISMPDQPKSERFKAEMPHIPGVAAGGASRPGRMANPTVRLVAGFLVVLIVCLVGSRWLLRSKHVAESPTGPPPPI